MLDRRGMIAGAAATLAVAGEIVRAGPAIAAEPWQKISPADAGFTADIESFARSRGLADQLACVGLARAFTFAGQGQHGPACDELLRVFDPTSPYHHERESLHGLMLLAETAGPEQVAAVAADSPALWSNAGDPAGDRFLSVEE